MREHIRQLIATAQPNRPVDLGAETVRLARIAAAVHAAEAAQSMTDTDRAETSELQEQCQ